jgi:primosomal protein N' (replication factor Y)
VQAEARAAFPGVLVERLDSDVAPDRRRQLEILDRFAREGPAVLVGTQLVLHALDHVALLGVVTADISLHFPDFRAAERTYQLLEALRGRLQAGAHLVVQSYTPDHYALAAVARDEPEHFYREELAVRERMRYPPFGSLGRLLVVGHPGVAEQAARELAARLREPAARHGVTVTGPAPPLVPRVGGRERWQLVLRGREAQQVAEVIRAGLGGVSTRAGLSVSVDVEPLDLT